MKQALEGAVATHYARTDLYEAIPAGLDAAGGVRFPVPWAACEATSFLHDADATEALLADAGFEIERRISLRDLPIGYFRDATAKASAGPPPLGLHLLTHRSRQSREVRQLRRVARGGTARAGDRRRTTSCQSMSGTTESPLQRREAAIPMRRYRRDARR